MERDTNFLEISELKKSFGSGETRQEVLRGVNFSSELKKSFGSGETRQEVLRGVNFSVRKGEFCVLLGPSGGVLAILFVIIGYALVTAIDFHRIKRIPLDEALKNVE